MVNFDNFRGLKSVLKFHIFICLTCEESVCIRLICQKLVRLFSDVKNWYSFFHKCEESLPIPDTLQTFLGIFDDYCTSWKLHMSTDKSKVVVFNSNGKQFFNTFKCANCTLETVNSYCYLGVTFKHNGSLTHTSKLLM